VGYSIVNRDEIEGAGAEAFGIAWVELPPGAGDERDPGGEEVCAIVRGSGTYEIDGESVEVREGTFVRFDAETTRRLVAGPDGLRMLAVGARRRHEPGRPL
jgi:uncharacterized cupin superfamily protein